MCLPAQGWPPFLQGFRKDGLLAVGKPKAYLEARDRQANPQKSIVPSNSVHIFQHMVVVFFLFLGLYVQMLEAFVIHATWIREF